MFLSKSFAWVCVIRGLHPRLEHSCFELRICFGFWRKWCLRSYDARHANPGVLVGSKRLLELVFFFSMFHDDIGSRNAIYTPSTGLIVLIMLERQPSQVGTPPRITRREGFGSIAALSAAFLAASCNTVRAGESPEGFPPFSFPKTIQGIDSVETIAAPHKATGSVIQVRWDILRRATKDGENGEESAPYDTRIEDVFRDTIRELRIRDVYCDTLTHVDAEVLRKCAKDAIKTQQTIDALVDKIDEDSILMRRLHLGLLDLTREAFEEKIGAIAPLAYDHSMTVHSCIPKQFILTPHDSRKVLHGFLEQISSVRGNCILAVSAQDWRSTFSKWNKENTSKNQHLIVVTLKDAKSE